MSIVIKDAELEMEFAMGLFEGICLDFANEPAVDVDETIAEYAFDWMIEKSYEEMLWNS